MIDNLPDAPDPANDAPTVFSQKAAAFVLAQKAMVSQINADIAAIGIVAAGGAFAPAFSLDSTSIANSDPGAGKLRFGSVAQSSSMAIYLDNLNAAAQDITWLLTAWGYSTSATKGYLKLVKQGDASKWIVFMVTAVTANTGYFALTVVPMQGSTSSPFASTDTLIAQFTPNGDTGIGAGPTFRVQHQSAGAGSAGNAVNGTNIRVLNTVLRNTLSGASLASNQVTIPAGTYKVTGSAPANAPNNHQTYLYNVTGAAVLIYGTAEYSANSGAAQTRSFIAGEIVLTAATVIELRHWIPSTGAGSLGVYGTALTNGIAVFAELLFEKVA